jgi:Spy/CpxP family protein refolding chaperone
MDWIHQNRLKTLLIVGLLGLNLVMVVLIWWKIPRAPESQVKENASRIPESVNLMKQVLELSDTQTQKVEAIMVARREDSKPAADRLAELKRQLAEDLFIDPPDTAHASSLAAEIGKTQATLEMNRFRHFRELLEVFTPEQKTAFKPVVIEVFGRKPPRDEVIGSPARKNDRRGGRAGDTLRDKPNEAVPPQKETPMSPSGEPSRPNMEPPPPREEKSGPPSVEEKLARYTQRLQLSDAQSRSIQSILLDARKKGEALRARKNPDREAVEAAKDQIRKEEDELIMKILNEEQQKEYAAMRARKPR